MPAKHKKLPQPCPKCGSLYGTVQVVFFNQMRKVKNQISRYDAWNRRPKPTHRRNGNHVGANAVFRIGHYDSELYKKTKKENNEFFNFQSEETKKQKLRTSQRRWCSFRSEILSDIKFRAYDFISQTMNLPLYDDVWDEVYNDGWQMIQKKKL